MKLIYKLLLVASIIFVNGCSTKMVPRGWKKQQVSYAYKTKPIVKSKGQKLKRTKKKISKKSYKRTDKKIKKSVEKKVRKKPKKRIKKRIKKIILSKSSKIHTKSYKKFKKNTNLRKSFKVYKDKKLLKQSTRKNTRLTVDISEQRVKLYVNNKIALDSPCTTGAKRKFEPNTKIYRDKRTPKGTFRITEKLSNKRSTIFGDYYRGKKHVYHGDKRKYKGSKRGLRYKGAALKNWMRLTSSGIGLHASQYVKRYPGTNGCIRLPVHVARTIFSKVRRGTEVVVRN